MNARDLVKKLPGAVPLVRWVRRILHGPATHPLDWGYQQIDRRIADYKLYRLPGLPLDLRGPPLPQSIPKGYFACVGAAQTFGRFCQEPFPQLLSERLGVPVVNLGVAGAGPRFFLRHPRLIQCMNDSRLVIVQVMSARSEDNSLFDSGGLEYVTIRSTGERMGSGPAYRRLLESGDMQRVRSVVAETRDNWLVSYERLLSRIGVPTILFWFSVREPDYLERHDDTAGLFGSFPQLVNREMVETVRSHCDAHVLCVTRRGLPQTLKHRRTGRQTSVSIRADLGDARQKKNTYYPSPEMHRDAAEVLEPVCRGFQDGTV